MTLTLDAVEGELTRLWTAEAKQSPAARVELLTFVAVASEARHLERAKQAAARVARVHPARTIVVRWMPGDVGAVRADVGLHRGEGGAACGDALVVEATGEGREWLPENLERLSLPDLPVCLWWVGDLPDRDRLFDRMLVGADLAVVNSAEMDLRDLEKIARIVEQSRVPCAVSDLTWMRLRPIFELIARFFDDPGSRKHLALVERVTISFSPGANPEAASTEAALLFGWIATALSLPPESARWSRAEPPAEVSLGRVVARFEPRPRSDVPGGTVLGIAIECGRARFAVERQADPDVLSWTPEIPGEATTPQMLRVTTHDEPTMLVRCLERPRRDELFEVSLQASSRVVRPIAPRLSGPPPRDA